MHYIINHITWMEATEAGLQRSRSVSDFTTRNNYTSILQSIPTVLGIYKARIGLQ